MHLEIKEAGLEKGDCMISQKRISIKLILVLGVIATFFQSCGDVGYDPMSQDEAGEIYKSLSTSYSSEKENCRVERRWDQEATTGSQNQKMKSFSKSCLARNLLSSELP